MTNPRPKRSADKRRLTELAVVKAKPRDDAYLIWDSAQRNLCVRVRPTGAKSWKVVYSRHGKPRWLHLGRADDGGIGLAEARTMAAETMLAVAKGRDPAAEKRAQRVGGTFADLATRYVEQHAKKNNRSWRQPEALVRRFALPRWGKLQASSITRGDVKTMMTWIEAPIVANQTLAAVSAIYSWGVKEELVAGNPCKLVDRNPTRSRERVLADSEIARFWSAFGEAGTVGAALKATLLTGQRPGEIAHMRWEHVKDGWWWEMPGAAIEGIWPGTKNVSSHRVWLPVPMQAILTEITGDDRPATGFVFAGSRGHPIDRLDGAMRTICAKLGIERVTPHDLRRTHGSTITGLGFGRDAMNRVQNHKEGGVTDTYDRHGYADENRRVMEAVAARIMALATGTAEGSNVINMVGGR